MRALERGGIPTVINVNMQASAKPEIRGNSASRAQAREGGGARSDAMPDTATSGVNLARAGESGSRRRSEILRDVLRDEVLGLEQPLDRLILRLLELVDR